METHSVLVRLALSMYLGETCIYCGYEYRTLEDLDNKDVVWAWNKDTDPPITNKGQSLACKICYEINKAGK